MVSGPYRKTDLRPPVAPPMRWTIRRYPSSLFFLIPTLSQIPVRMLTGMPMGVYGAFCVVLVVAWSAVCLRRVPR